MLSALHRQKESLASKENLRAGKAYFERKSAESRERERERERTVSIKRFAS